MLKIHSIETLGTHEWPGIRFVLFLQWCMFKCLYCHNPDTIPMIWGKEVSVGQIFRQVLQSKPYFGNRWWFTVSWWEPLLQAKELIPLFELLKAEWIHTAIDTNGFPRNEDVRKIIDLTDLFLVDIKHIRDDRHIAITWQSNTNTLKLLEYLNDKQKEIRLRYVLVNGWTDDEVYLDEIWQKFSKYEFIRRIEILPYHQLWVHKRKEMWRKYELENMPSTTIHQAQEVSKVFEKYFQKVVIR